MATVPSQMPSLVLHDFGEMRLVTRPTPSPAAGEALVRTIATGICGSDIHGYTGHNGRRHPGQVMGHETVGEVVALDPGAGGAGIAEGDVVVTNPGLACGRCSRCSDGAPQLCLTRRVIGVDPSITSAFAGFMSAPVGNLVPFRGERLHGALVEPLAVGYHAGVRGQIGPGMSVLVVGGGPIGQAAALGARRLGASRVLVSEPMRPRRTLVEQLGFRAIDPAGDALAQEVARLTEGEGVDVALDAVGSSGTIRDALGATRPGGRVVLVGMGAPGVELPAYEISTLERELVGAFCYTPEHFAETASWAERNGRWLAPLVSRVVAPSEAPAAFAALAAGSDDASKVVVSFEAPA